MRAIQLLQISPDDLANIIKEGIKPELEGLLKKHSLQVPSKKEFLTRKETAEFFGISLVCLHSWCKEGILTPLKMGNRTYFEYSKLVSCLVDSNKRR